MNKTEFNDFGEAVRDQGKNQGNAMSDLVFDSSTGEFRQVPKGTKNGPGDVVTEMTEGGFA